MPNRKAEPPKRDYRKPELTDLGSLAEITRSGAPGSGIEDGGAGYS